jgi:uncharacterized protein YdhG (YjbR/CyaY superfamily)
VSHRRADEREPTGDTARRRPSLYPEPRGDDAFERQLGPYRSEKSALKFPLSKPVPCDLIEQLARLAAARVS